MDQLSIRLRGRECASLLSACLAASFKKTLAYETTLPPSVLEMEGASGVAYRMLINNLIAATPYPRYLEVGSWPGSTASAAMSGNVASVLCIDDWSAPGSSAAALVGAMEQVRSSFNSFDVCSSDFRAVDYTAIGTFNVYLYSGPHDRAAQVDGILLPMDGLDDEFILVAEDWNDAEVRAATNDAIRTATLTCLHGLEIRTTQDGRPAVDLGKESDWHNGYFIGAFLKGPR